MNNLTTDSMMMERRGVFNEEKTKRFELTFECSGLEEAGSILVIGLNPNSRDIMTMDTTTFLTLNNLLPMGFSTITICNLFANIFRKLRMSAIPDNDENMESLSQILDRNFDKILLCYGNTCINNQRVQKEKARLLELLRPWKDRVVVIMDTERIYEHLSTIHPLMAGRYFPGGWELIPFNMPEPGTEEREEKSDLEDVNPGEKGDSSLEDVSPGEKGDSSLKDVSSDVEGRNDMDGTDAESSSDEKNDETDEMVIKKTSKRKKTARKEDVEENDSDCGESETAERTDSESAEADS